MKLPHSLTAVLVACQLGLVAQDNMGFPVRAEVAQGTLEGRYSTHSGVQTYLGIPYAMPPVDELRWRPPQPAEEWEGVRQANEFGPRAVQRYVHDDMRFRSPLVSEDCLYLNVWTSHRLGQNPLSVLVYFHGGGNTTGSGDELRYDGEALAREGIVVVTVNYRLGLFGFLNHPELSAEQGGHSGNYAILDQIAALEWVRDNIAAFGGDPERITIAGESAGSIDVSVLMTSPLSRDLIAGALGQSGAAIYPTFTPVSAEEGADAGAVFLQQAGANSITELRGFTTRQLYEAAYLNKSYAFPANLLIDGYVLPRQPREMLAAGEQADVPLLIGWTSAEAAWTDEPKDEEAYNDLSHSRFGSAGDSLRTYYAASDRRRAAVDMVSDSWIVYSTWKWADLHARTASAPVYRYRFDRVRPPLKGQQRDTEPIGAGHATDIEYFMNTLEKSDAYQWGNEDRKAAADISAYLVNFVKSGDPNGSGLPAWEPLSQGSDAPPVMHLNTDSELRRSEVEDRYRALDDYYTTPNR